MSFCEYYWWGASTVKMVGFGSFFVSQLISSIVANASPSFCTCSDMFSIEEILQSKVLQ